MFDKHCFAIWPNGIRKANFKCLIKNFIIWSWPKHQQNNQTLFVKHLRFDYQAMFERLARSARQAKRNKTFYT